MTVSLLEIDGTSARESTKTTLSHLQNFFVANPEYFVLVNGMAPREDEAQLEFESRPPPEIPFEKVFVIGFFDRTGHGCDDHYRFESIDRRNLAYRVVHRAHEISRVWTCRFNICRNWSVAASARGALDPSRRCKREHKG